ncbi:MAG: hypothetical protein K2K97_07540, partial [Muribaculaceae bacterium]|nr:hypothetical protein [Muribaculaceae bacterium]
TELLNNENVQYEIRNSWNKRIFINPEWMCNDSDDLYQFSDDCLRLFNEVPSLNARNSFIDRNISKLAKKFFSRNKSQSLFYIEKKFVLAITEPDVHRAKTYLQEIKEIYTPARIILKSSSNSFYIQNLKLNLCVYFKLGYVADNANNLNQFIPFLKEFRNYVEPGK